MGQWRSGGYLSEIQRRIEIIQDSCEVIVVQRGDVDMLDERIDVKPRGTRGKKGARSDE
jgi:hypothetical protein